MKMSIARKQNTVMTKVKDGRSRLPVINALEISEPAVAPTTFELHCDHVKVTYENITPLKATKMLERNHLNRKIYQAMVEQYANDMKSGKWGYCTAPIALYDNGEIADGQHRLWAVIESNRSQKFCVMRGVRQADGLNIDMGKGRTVVDAVKISGLDTITSNLVSATRSIEEGVASHGRSSNAEKLRIIDKHRAAGMFVIGHVYGKKIGNGAIMGAVGRAWYKVEDKDKLIRYCEVLRTGQSNGLHESAAVTMRNYLLSAEANLASSALWVDTFKRAQRTIQAFVAGRQLLAIRAQDNEIYPL